MKIVSDTFFVSPFHVNKVTGEMQLATPYIDALINPQDFVWIAKVGRHDVRIDAESISIAWSTTKIDDLMYLLRYLDYKCIDIEEAQYAYQFEWAGKVYTIRTFYNPNSGASVDIDVYNKITGQQYGKRINQLTVNNGLLFSTTRALLIHIRKMLHG